MVKKTKEKIIAGVKWFRGQVRFTGRLAYTMASYYLNSLATYKWSGILTMLADGQITNRDDWITKISKWMKQRVKKFLMINRGSRLNIVDLQVSNIPFMLKYIQHQTKVFSKIEGIALNRNPTELIGILQDQTKIGRYTYREI